MKIKSSAATLAVVGTALFLVTSAKAHISIASNPSVADVAQEIVFQVAHGCPRGAGLPNADTWKVTVEVPATFSSIRPMTSDFGPVTVTKDGVTNITSITWQKPDANVLAADTNFYKLTIRMKPPNTPFTRISIPSHQYCKDPAAPAGPPLVVHWTGLPGQDAGADEPAAELLVMPAKQPGWNKYTVPADITDLKPIFKDALIVWKGSAAFSGNPNTVTQIKGEATAGVTELTELKANDEIWVRY